MQNKSEKKKALKGNWSDLHDSSKKDFDKEANIYLMVEIEEVTKYYTDDDDIDESVQEAFDKIMTKLKGNIK